MFNYNFLIMKTFYMVSADDNSRCLYVWDSTLKTMDLVINAVWANGLKHNIYVVEDFQGKLKVFALKNSAIHEFDVPTKDIKLACGHCIWRVGDSYYGYDYVTRNIRLLGVCTRLNVSIKVLWSCEEVFKDCFIQNNSDETKKLVFIRAEGIIDAGDYVKIETGIEDIVVAFKDDIYCDVYSLKPPYLKKPDKELYFSLYIKGAFYWQETKECWAYLGDGLALASNAFQTNYLKDGKIYASLYSVEGINKKLVAEGQWKCRDDIDVATCINGIEYRYQNPNADNKILDFGNPRPIKKFFGLF